MFVELQFKQTWNCLDESKNDCQKIVKFSEQEIKKINPEEGLAESVKKEMLAGCLEGYADNPKFADCVRNANKMEDFTGCH